MSFGFSVGDFINVGTLAYQLYQRCRASVTEFKDLSRDVRSMHITLTAISEYWEEQAQDGHELSTRHLATLQELSESCKEVLEDVEALLDKHGDLGAGAGFLARMKWAPKHIGPLRMRLLVRTNSLSTFNNVMTASSASNEQRRSQARVLAALNVINYGYHSGKRPAPAFSQATTEKIDVDNKETWKEIVQDLNDEGIDKESLDLQKTFIKNWIDEVILDEGYASDDGSQVESERESYSVAPSSFMEGEPYNVTIASQPPASPNRNPRDLFRAQTVPIATMQPPVELSYRRPRQSQGSLSSQDYRARLEQPHTPSTSNIKETLMPLFRLEYGVSRNELFLQSTIERLYHRLDFLQRGLYRAQFENQCLQVVESIEPSARASIVEIIHAAARTTGGHFDQAAFTELFFAILGDLQSIKEKELEARVQEDQAVVEESDQWGESIAYSWISTETEPELVRRILPRRYATIDSESGISMFTSIPEDIICHNISGPNVPAAAMSTFAGMVLLAEFCNAQILHICEVWSHDNPIDRDYLNQYLHILYNVLDAGHKFDVLAGDSHQKQSNLLDRLIGESDLIDLADPSNLELESCPTQELRRLQHDSYRTLQKMFGFLFDLTSEVVQKDVKDKGMVEFVPGRQGGLVLKYLETPPRPAHWRMKMEIQAETILAECVQWQSRSGPIVARCQNWYLEHKSLSRKAENALNCSKKLKQQAKKCHHLIPRHISDPITEKFVCLRIESLKDLPRGNKVFRAQDPKIFAKIIIDNERLHHQSATLEKRGSHKVYLWGGDPYHITVHAKSTIQIRIHNANRNDRFDEGYLGAVNIRVDSLVTAIQARPQTVELSNSFFKGTECKGMLTFTVHWCTTAHFVRQQAGLFSGHWARKDTADGRFLFEDLQARDIGPDSRTAIVEQRRDSLKLTPLKLRIAKPR